MAWFEKSPLLLQKEEEALVQAGYEYNIDEVAQSEGRLIIKVNYYNPSLIDDETHVLTCIYPAAYPYFSMEVFGPTLPSGRHINPFDHRLCLIQDEQNEWRPSSDCLAKVLKEQLPTILERHRNSDKPSMNEEQVGYQVTGQMIFEPASVIYVDETSIPDSAIHGKMCVKLNAGCCPDTPLIGMIESVEYDSNVIMVADGPLGNIFTKAHSGRWVRLNVLPGTLSDSILLNEAIEICPAIKTPNYGKLGVDIVGLLIQEESDYRILVHNWVFLVRRRPPKKSNNKHNPAPVLVRSDRYTKDNIHKRIPRLRVLSGKHVTIIGVGALGSQLAWQLVRSGIDSITLIDNDIVQAGNLPRWVVGFPAIGRNKVDVIAEHLINNFPGVKCRRFKLQVGVGQLLNVDGVPLDAHEFLCQLIEESDLLIDSAAETNVSLYLSNICEEQKISYVWATGTQGAWGGIVGRVIPGVTEGTWTDFSYKYAFGEIFAPPAEENSDIQPIGCFSPTFTGSGFDMDHISLMATRVSVATLCHAEDGYSNFDWDVGVLHMWDENTRLPIAPKWDTYKLSGRKEDEPI